MRALWAKLRRIFDRRSIGDGIEQEIDSHLEFLVDENIARGMTPEEAQELAQRQFGSMTITRERAREAWTFPTFESILQDVRYGLRGMRRHPAFTTTILLTLALGIGAATAIFSVVYTALLRPLPYPGGERLVILEESTRKAHGFSVTWVNFEHWKRENHTFEEMAAREFAHLTLTGRGDPLLTRAGVVTSGFFGLAGARPLMGRFFTEADDRFGARPTVVLTREFWAATLGGDPNIVGGTLALNGKAYEVIGVAPPGLHLIGVPVDVYLPMGLLRGNTVNRSQHASIRVLARLKPGVTLSDARSDLDSIMERLARVDPGPESEHRVVAEYLAESIAGDIRSTLLMIMAAVGMVLAIACANVASLLLVRGAARVREMAIRTAIGAGAARLARQLVTENLLMTAAGGALGVGLAAWCLRALVTAAPPAIPRLSEVTIDVPVLLFAAGITALTGLLAGFAPVVAARKAELAAALKESSQTATSARRSHSVRSAFVTAEIAITLMLAFASSLLLRSLITAETADPGFVPEHVLELEMVLPASAYRTQDAQTQFYDRLSRDLRSVPGVVDAGAVMCPPAVGDCGDFFYSVVGKPAPAQGDVPVAFVNVADPRYFEALRIPLREGRFFSETDRAGGPPVAVVNENFARRWWPKEPAIGHRIKWGGPYMPGAVREIVGVVGDVSRMGLDEKPGPEIYLPMAQSPSNGMALMIRTAGDPRALIAEVRRRVAALDRNLPVQRLRTLEDNLAASLSRRKFSTALLTLFAALAMTLAAIGIYGVLNYWVLVREDEIAVRLAMGAQPSAILRWACAAVMRLAVLGIALGMAGAWAASRWLESLVYGVSPRSPAMMAASAAIVLAIAAISSAIPLLRAMRVDAVRHLRRA